MAVVEGAEINGSGGGAEINGSVGAGYENQSSSTGRKNPIEIQHIKTTRVMRMA